DGIRDGHVTGVQTCALPIWLLWGQTYCSGVMKCPAIAEPAAQHTNYSGPCDAMASVLELINAIHRWNRTYPGGGKIERVIARKRSEERRVGKECRGGRST